MPKLSIITVNLNNKSGLYDTANSIITQTWTDYEWIIIDGGSTDGSVDIIKEYSEITDKLTFWCSEPDNGIYHGMNKGIYKASGEYCLFLNSGDWIISSETLKNVFFEINGRISDIFYSDMMDSNNVIYKLPINLTIDFLIKSPINHQNSLIKRSLFIEHSFYNENLKLVSDWEFWLKEYWKYKSIFSHIDTKISVYNFNGISSVKSRYYNESLIIISNVFNELSNIIFEYIEYQKFKEDIYYNIIKFHGNTKILIILLRIYRKIINIYKKVINFKYDK